MSTAVHIRDLETRTDLEDLCALLTRVWRTEGPLLPFSLVRALSHAGGMVLGAYAGEELIGGAVGFRSADHPEKLHSHIVGVDHRWQGHGVGTAIKLHQRQWCLDREITEITWTFDPLVRLNATFNIGRLGAAGIAYHPDYYGPMDDAYNAGVPTDRVLVRWELTAPRAGTLPAHRPAPALDVGAHGEPVPGAVVPAGGDVWLRVPRVLPTEHALAWRHALREVMAPRLDGGYRWTGVTGEGWYVLTPPEPTTRESK
jgi:predicted GNAT superfamily acetyltransferase